MIPTLIVISAITFFMGYAAPGDPVTLILGERARADQVAALKQQYGLDQPPVVQFGRFLAGLSKGDLGLSYAYRGRKVSEIIMKGFKVSLQLGGAAAIFAWTTGLTLGILAAVNRGRWLDNLAMLLAVVGVSVPIFVEAIAFMYIFGVYMKVLPAVGWGEPQHFVLPAVVLGTRSAAVIARITRSSMLEVLGQDYIRTARAKGLAAGTVTLKHAVKNAMIPVITVLGTTLGTLLTGAFITETIFGIPGIGRVSLQAIFQRDYPVVQATVLLFAAVFVLINLVVDLMYGVVDPRIRFS